MGILGLEKYIGSVGSDYDRSVGVSNDPDVWKRNFADVLVDGDVDDEIARADRVIKDRERQGLDISAQVTYKNQLIEARKITGSDDGTKTDYSRTAGNFGLGGTGGQLSRNYLFSLSAGSEEVEPEVKKDPVGLPDWIKETATVQKSKLDLFFEWIGENWKGVGLGVIALAVVGLLKELLD